MPDELFADPRLARIYDDLDGDRDDLDLYAALPAEFGARRVLDVGCGTGVLARRLAASGRSVTGVDPATASLDVARAADPDRSVTWIDGTVDAVPTDELFDLAVMTGNVAMVFVDDADWAETLRHIRRRLRDGGRFVFETRDPDARAWETWATRLTRTVDTVEGTVATDFDLLDVSLPLVSFRWTITFADGDVRASDTTLHYRTVPDLTWELGAAGFVLDEVRDAPDRPGLEFVVVARAV